jgi:hypothetical protein
MRAASIGQEANMERVTFDKRYIQQLANAHHVDLNHLPTKEELDRKTAEQATQQLKRDKMARYYSYSVWSGNIPLKVLVWQLGYC